MCMMGENSIRELVFALDIKLRIGLTRYEDCEKVNAL